MLLIVDDSEVARNHVRKMLSPTYQCYVAASAAEAIDLISISNFEAIISDVEMPGMSGVELLKKVKSMERAKSTPFILLTSVTDINLVNEARRLGCAGFILKPAHKELLISKLRTLLRT
jgi:DNA-binding NarL/FixJ family response regulator